MGKIKQKRNNKTKVKPLDRHNAFGYIKDVNHICKLGYIDSSKRDWIETTMLRLRDSANIYEHRFGEFLINKKIEFIHQAPFILSGKIYFADFFFAKISSNSRN